MTNITARDVVKVLTKLGFKLDRQKGSHAVYYHPDAKTRAVVPIHGKKTIKPKTLQGILRDIGMSPEEFLRLLKK